LFLARARRFLTGLPQRLVYNVPFQIEGVPAESGPEWERHLSWTLAPTQAGTAAEHLARVCRQAQPFIILGLQPLHDLSPEQRAGLQEFLEVQ
jgi:hypothetical protein